jgi:hypothetical protein
MTGRNLLTSFLEEMEGQRIYVVRKTCMENWMDDYIFTWNVKKDRHLGSFVYFMLKLLEKESDVKLFAVEKGKKLDEAIFFEGDAEKMEKIDEEIEKAIHAMREYATNLSEFFWVPESHCERKPLEDSMNAMYEKTSNLAVKSFYYAINPIDNLIFVENRKIQFGRFIKRVFDTPRMARIFFLFMGKKSQENLQVFYKTFEEQIEILEQFPREEDVKQAIQNFKDARAYIFPK